MRTGFIGLSHSAHLDAAGLWALMLAVQRHVPGEFAKEILTPASSDDDGVPLIKPEMAGRRGPKPALDRLSSLKAEAALIALQFKQKHGGGTPWNQMAVLYSARFIAEELIAEFTSNNIPFEWMNDRASKRFDPNSASVKVITLHSSKGLEFPIVAIIGLGFMPYSEAEAADEARLLYVGMTRATDELLMTASRDSEFAMRLLTIQKAA